MGKYCFMLYYGPCRSVVSGYTFCQSFRSGLNRIRSDHLENRIPGSGFRPVRSMVIILPSPPKYTYTVCPRNSDPFHIVSYYIKWVTTSWTYRIKSVEFSYFFKIILLHDSYIPSCFLFLLFWSGAPLWTCLSCTHSLTYSQV